MRRTTWAKTMMQASKKKPGRTIVTAFGWLGVTTNDAVFEVLIMGGKRTVSTVSHNRCFTSQTFSFTIAVCDLWLATLFFKRFSNLAMYRLPFLGAVFFVLTKAGIPKRELLGGWGKTSPPLLKLTDSKFATLKIGRSVGHPKKSFGRKFIFLQVLAGKNFRGELEPVSFREAGIPSIANQT